MRSFDEQSTRSNFTDEEWARLESAPLVACAAVSLADRGGAIGYLKESFVGIKTLLETAKSGGHGELVDAVARSAMKNPQKHRSKGFKPTRRRPVEQALDELRAVDQLLTMKAPREEAAAFREWLFATAEQAAVAAQEGFGRERVSKREERILEKLREVLSLPVP